MDVRTEKEGTFTKLFDTYGELLTGKQREICSLYLEYDLSLGEIGEEKGISRQSVSDCLRTACEQMKEYEDKLSLIALKEEFSAYRRKVKNALNSVPGVADEVRKALLD
ncbi:MAG: sigma factor-like helix-turn-helix DNA-binding protein [Candidatus Scatosoma sp.]